jgi:hypothetical protein
MIDKEAEVATVDRWLDKHVQRFVERQESYLEGFNAGAGSGSYGASAAAPAAPAAPPAPAAVQDLPRSLVESMVDPATNRLRFTNHGPLPGVPADDRQPAIVRAYAELSQIYGAYLSELPLRQAEIARHSSTEERVLKTARYLDDVGTFAAEAKRQIEAKIGECRKAIATLEADLTAPGGDLDETTARRLAEHVQRLPETQRQPLLNRMRQDGDHAALRAVALDPVTRWACPKLDRDELLMTAGRLRTPGRAQVLDGYKALIERAETVAHKIREAVQAATFAATSAVDGDKLRLARRARQH